MNKYGCLDCKHFYFEEEWPGYSEYTPGSPMQMSCKKNKWDIAEDASSKSDVCHLLDKAKSCDLYEEESD